MNTTTLTWPPQFTIKKSTRARYAKLKASVRDGLELVVPARFNQKAIPEILETNKVWIERQLAKINVQRKSIDSRALPDEIHLPPLRQHWKVRYVKSDNKKLQILERPNHEVVLLGNIENKNACKILLRTWVRQKADVYLPHRIEHLSEKTGLTFKKVTIRNQRSRWGSCTATKTINLNYKLIFLPLHLSDHIIIHELCHTVHMDHSTRFWRLVAKFDDAWKKHSHEARDGDKYIPLWALE